MARFDEFWEVVCDFRYILRIGFMFVVFLFVLAVLSLILAERGTDAYAISLFNFVAVSALGLTIAYMNWVCANRDRQYY